MSDATPTQSWVPSSENAGRTSETQTWASVRRSDCTTETLPNDEVRASRDIVIRSLYAERRQVLSDLRKKPERVAQLRRFLADIEQTINQLELAEQQAAPKSDVWDKLDHLATRLLAVHETLDKK